MKLDPYKAMEQALEARRIGLTPEQAEARAKNDARAAAIQAVGPKPVDGVTFGKKA